jgi:hypothetical protein
LFSTEREDDFYEGLFQADGKTPIKPPEFKGRIITTLQKAKEARPHIERCITLAKRAAAATGRSPEVCNFCGAKFRRMAGLAKER